MFVSGELSKLTVKNLLLEKRTVFTLLTAKTNENREPQNLSLLSFFSKFI